MALKLKKKDGFKVESTTIKLDESYARISLNHLITGHSVAAIVYFDSRDHYDNMKKPQIAQSNRVVITPDTRINKIEALTILDAHDKYKELFETEGFEVEIVDL